MLMDVSRQFPVPSPARVATPPTTNARLSRTVCLDPPPVRRLPTNLLFPIGGRHEDWVHR